MNMRRALGNSLSQPDPFHLILGEPLLRAVVKFGRARALVRRHFLGMLERAAVREIGGDAGRPERVAADRLGDAGRRSTSPGCSIISEYVTTRAMRPAATQDVI